MNKIKLSAPNLNLCFSIAFKCYPLACIRPWLQHPYLDPSSTASTSSFSMNSMNVWHWAWVQLLVLLLPMETSTSMLGGGARVLGRSRGQGMRRKRAAAAGIRSSEVSSEICSAPTSMPPPPSAPPSPRYLWMARGQGRRRAASSLGRALSNGPNRERLFGPRRASASV